MVYIYLNYMNLKTTISITVDTDVIKKHRNAGNNVSKLCNDFLKSFEFPKDKAIAAIKEEGQQKINAVEKAASAVDNTLKINTMLREALKHRATNSSKTNEILKDICKTYNLEWGEVVRRMERL